VGPGVGSRGGDGCDSRCESGRSPRTGVVCADEGLRFLVGDLGRRAAERSDPGAWLSVHEALGSGIFEERRSSPCGRGDGPDIAAFAGRGYGLRCKADLMME
jgi:hypothetical protein